MEQKHHKTVSSWIENRGILQVTEDMQLFDGVRSVHGGVSTWQTPPHCNLKKDFMFHILLSR